MRLLFLDIDGVLNDETCNESGYAGIHPSKVKRLNQVFKTYPDCRIVISSAWKCFIESGDLTLRGFEIMLGACGLHGTKVVGVTPSNVGKSGYYELTRAREIETWLEQNNLTGAKYVIVDDLPLPHDNLVQTNYKFGLIQTDVDRIIEKLK